MGISTRIEYADSTCNAVMGCDGCEFYSPDPGLNHCYAATLCRRYAGRKGWPGRFDQPEHFPHRIPQALHWPDLTGTEREDKPWLNGFPRVIFVNDLSDGFCPTVDPEEWLLPQLNAMGESPHIWLLLTKWARQMRHFCEAHPLPKNVWPGVTVCRQKDEWRIGELLSFRAVAPVQWLSLEPLLGPVDLSAYLYQSCTVCWGPGDDDWGYDAEPLDTWLWAIAGGGSGPNARPMHPDWARAIRDQCQDADQPFLFKQWGEWVSASMVAGAGAHHYFPDGATVRRVGKKAAGRLLDGREWNEMPEWETKGQ